MNVKILIYYFLLLFSVSSEISAKKLSEGKDNYYLGINLGILNRNIGYSEFEALVGASALYNWNKNIINVSYDRLYILQLKGEQDSYWDAEFHRFELNYARQFNISDNLPLLKELACNLSAGISYNSILYYKDEHFSSNEELTHVYKAGASLSISLTNKIGSALYGGLGWKLHVLRGFEPGNELTVFFMVRI